MKKIGIGIEEDTEKVISSVINSGISDQIVLYCKPGVVDDSDRCTHHSRLGTSRAGPCQRPHEEG